MVKEIVAQLRGEYLQEYYTGIIDERWGNSQLQKGLPHDISIGWIRSVMRHYERAVALAKPDDPDAILRWNTCARILARMGDAGSDSVPLTRDVPPR